MKLRNPLRRDHGAKHGNGNGNGNDAAGTPAAPAIQSDDPLAEIATLTEANRDNGDPARESRLVGLRNLAFEQLDRSVPSSSPEGLAEVPAERARHRIVDGLPEVDAPELDALTIRAAFLSHGALLVRGLIPTERARELAGGIDRAFDGRDAFLEGTPAAETAPWFFPFAPPKSTKGADWNRLKAGGGSVWLSDSPRMMFELLDTFEEHGVKRIAADYLGEPPAFSMNKSVLRRVSPDNGTAWHQDGAFLGEGIRTLNVWLALNHCGDTAPGLDVLPKRLDEIVPTGTEGAIFPWAVSDHLADELAGGEPIPRPIFEPGDALLFDHLCLHRTAAEADMPEQRYATETWCFAPSSYPDKLIPLVV